jgi:beta-lactamase class A
MSGAPEKLAADLRDIVRAFCGDDTGRSVAFLAHKPAMPLLSVRGGEPRPAASVMKVALAMAVFAEAAQGKIDLSARVPVLAFSSTRYVSILAGFDRGRELSIREICRLALMTSDNPLAVHMQSLVGFGAVNARLAEIGCGPPCHMGAGFSEDELGAKNRASVLTADPAVHLFSVLRADPRYADLMLALKNNLRNNRIPSLLPEHVAVFHKTGSLDGVANDAGIVQDDSVDFTVAFLTDRQADTTQTSNDIAACSLRLYERLLAA